MFATPLLLSSQTLSYWYMNPIFDEYIEYRIAHNTYAESNRNSISFYIQSVLRGLDIKNMSTKQVLKKVMTYTARPDIKTTTKKKAVFAVKGFCDYLVTKKMNKNIDLETLNRSLPKIKIEVPTKTPAEMITEDDLKTLINTCRTDRDRALIMTLYESGARPSEILNLRWNRIKRDEHGMMLSVHDYKNNRERFSRLVMATPYLQVLLDSNSQLENSNWFVFPYRRGNKFKPLTPYGLRYLLKRLAKKAGLDKNIYPYLLRHSRVSALVTEGFPESALKLMCWGSLRSNQLSNYAHLQDERVVDQAIQNHYGMKNPSKEQKKNYISSLQCGVCQSINKLGSQYCATCGTPLTGKARYTKNQLETMLARILKEHPELLQS